MPTPSGSDYDFDLDPVTFLTIGTEGPPGQRTFYLQAAEGSLIVTLVIEKEQAMALVASIVRLLAAVERHDPEHASDLAPLDVDMALLPPVEPAFRVGQMGIGVDEARHAIVLVAQELSEDGQAQRARFVATYRQMATLSRQAMRVIAQGRPTCDLCGEPLEADGHFCPRRNGHPSSRPRG